MAQSLAQKAWLVRFKAEHGVCYSVYRRRVSEKARSEHVERESRRNRTQAGRIAKAQRARETRNLIWAAKSGPCADCKRKFPPYVMDFDHVRGKKRFAIGSRSWGIAALLKEMKKCDVVCANCHRIRTYKRLKGDWE